MEIIYTVDNFIENGVAREINSPRSLEACLRLGIDPSELAPKPKTAFASKELTAELVDAKYAHFQRKREEKIAAVKAEREHILKYGLKKHPAGASAPNSPAKGAATGGGEEKKSAMLEMEEKRVEALRRRQEKEIQKIVEKEQVTASLQLKIKRAEDEERRKKKEHEKKVAEMKIAEEKRANQRAKELKQLEEEEAIKKRELARKEAEHEEKMKKERKEMEKRMVAEAKARDFERLQKIEEAQRKTDALIQAQFDLAEENRQKMQEREQRVRSQLEAMKVKKREEMEELKEKATQRIAEALEKHHGIQVQKKLEFDERQKEALARAKEKAIEQRELLKQQADARDKKERARINRLVDSYRSRKEYRDSIVERREEKQSIFGKLRADREYQTLLLKFNSELKMSDKWENVERVARQREFQRLQTLKKIEDEDLRYESIMEKRHDMLTKHRDQMKQTLIRKHEISDAMEAMRTSNDFTLLDKLFAKQTKKDPNRTGRGDDDDEGAAGVRATTS